MHTCHYRWLCIAALAFATAAAFALPGPALRPGPIGQVNITAGIGTGDIDIDGNVRRFEQYVTPAQGPYLNVVGVNFYSPNGAVLLDAGVTGLGAPSVQANGWLSAFGGAAVLTGQQRRSSFYRDWSDTASPMKRNDGQYELTVPAGRGAFRVAYEDVSLVGPDEDWIRSMPSAAYVTPIGKWQGGIGYGGESFTFHTGPQLTGDTNVLSLQLNSPYTSRTAFEASAALLDTELDGFTRGPGGTKFALRGVHDAGSDFTFTGEVTRDEITDAITENAYARRDLGGDVRMSYLGIPRTAVEIGGGKHRVNYVNAPQTGSFDVDENSVYARLTTRFNRHVRLRLIHEQFDTDSLPSAFPTLDDPAPSLVWSDRTDSRAELTVTPFSRLGLTGRLRKVYWSNSEQDTENSLLQNSVYAWFVPSQKVTLYAGYLRQNFDLNVTSLTGNLYDTDDETKVVGATYQASPRVQLDLSMAQSRCIGSQGSAQSWVALGASYEMPFGALLTARGVWDDFDAAAADENYEGNWFEIGLSRFFF